MTETPEKLIEITKKAYAVIKGHREGVLQSELWKMLEIDSRTCSRILKILEEEGKIAREKVKGNTYNITAVNHERVIDSALLMAGESIVPCVACTEECDVPNCKLLEDWIYELVFSEME